MTVELIRAKIKLHKMASVAGASIGTGVASVVYGLILAAIASTWGEYHPWQYWWVAGYVVANLVGFTTIARQAKRVRDLTR